MPYKRQTVKYYWRATLNNGSVRWFNHESARPITRVPIRIQQTNMTNNRVNTFLNRVNLNTNQGVTWEVFISRG